MRNGGSPSQLFIVIFTDLDGTLLDHTSYGWEEAELALNFCKRLHVPVIPVSSKTRGEMDVVRKTLGLSYPFISENGGGIFFPTEEGQKTPPGTIFAGDIWKWSLGKPYEFLVNALREIKTELGWNLRGFSEMSPEEIARLTGLDLETSRLASKREYDEPFIVLEQEDPDADLLSEAAKRRGLHITSGGRFYHLQGKGDKGEAVGKLIAWYKQSHSQIRTIALGDSPNDFSMLKRVNHPVLVRSGRRFHGLEKMIPGLIVTREKGPRGWNRAVLDLLRTLIPNPDEPVGT